jgi:pentatricopeptide repeat protein
MTDNGVGPDLMTHSIILSAFKTGGQPRHAVAYYDHLISKKVPVDRYSQMRNMNGCEPDVVTFNSLLHVYAVGGEIKKARETFDMMIGKHSSSKFRYTGEIYSAVRRHY